MRRAVTDVPCLPNRILVSLPLRLPRVSQTLPLAQGRTFSAPICTLSFLQVGPDCLSTPFYRLGHSLLQTPALTIRGKHASQTVWARSQLSLTYHTHTDLCYQLPDPLTDVLLKLSSKVLGKCLKGWWICIGLIKARLCRRWSSVPLLPPFSPEHKTHSHTKKRHQQQTNPPYWRLDPTPVLPLQPSCFAKGWERSDSSPYRSISKQVFVCALLQLVQLSLQRKKTCFVMDLTVMVCVSFGVNYYY